MKISRTNILSVLALFLFPYSGVAALTDADSVFARAASVIGLPVDISTINQRTDTGNKYGTWIDMKHRQTYGTDKKTYDYVVEMVNYNISGIKDGFQLSLLYSSADASYEIDFMAKYKDGLMQKAFLRYGEVDMTICIDNVGPVDSRRFKDIELLTARLTASNLTPYGWVQYRTRTYICGVLRSEGWNISQLDTANSFDFETDAFIEIGEWTYYDETGCRETISNKNASAINILSQYQKSLKP